MARLSFAAAVSLATLLAACGQNTPPTAPASAPVTAASVPALPQNTLGESVYKKTCALCHAAGVAGAPKLNDKEDWGQRLAQGMDTVYAHAINGFTGEKGLMPPRGGAMSQSDEEVKAAVDYMVSTAQ